MDILSYNLRLHLAAKLSFCQVDSSKIRTQLDNTVDAGKVRYAGKL
ncbi:hypothetical protein [Photobacterium profundum]|nr:hypothetical protein [Photobacterium profundum]